MIPKSPVKYRPKGDYVVVDYIDIPEKDLIEAEKRGIEDGKDPADVLRDKATVYERDLQKKWGKELDERIGFNTIRVRQWENLLRPVIQDLLMAKEEFRERLTLRKHKLSDSLLNQNYYVLLLLLITFVEIPINFQVFDIFGENIAFTIILAVVLSSVLGLVSHFVGGWMKSEGIKFRSIIMCVFVIALLGILAWVRLRFFAKSEFSSIKDYFTTDRDTAILASMFFIINTLLFFMAIVASYQHSDSEPLFVRAKKRYDDLYAKVSNLISVIESEVINIQMCLSRCQECFKKHRNTYIAAYKSTGSPEPLCFKESITIEQEKITRLDERIKGVEQDFNELRKKVNEILEPVSS